MRQDFEIFVFEYLKNLKNCFSSKNIEKLHFLSEKILEIWEENNCLFICGNGGSSANAEHIANDFHYGIAEISNNKNKGLKVDALTSNSAIVTCLANDIGYENIFSYQLSVKAKKKDLLLVLSGSGNSKNIIKALEKANEIGIFSVAVLGFDGGKAKDIATLPIHFPIDDMQISEDLQMISMNICMKWIAELTKNRGTCQN